MNEQMIRKIREVLERETDKKSLKSAYGKMIISASGWRKIFSATQDEQEKNTEIPDEDVLLVAHIALAIAEYLKDETRTLIIARDARINGQMITAVLLSLLASPHRDIRYLSIASAPETFAYSSAVPDSLFIYVSASHNPIAHNGFKFGERGGVFDRASSQELINQFRTIIEDETSPDRIRDLLSAVSDEKLSSIIDSSPVYKKEALDAYYELLLRTHDIEKEDHPVRRKIRENRMGIVGELNGSARSVSIDQRLFDSLGITFRSFNDIPGDVVHEIVPEGENLDLCRTLVEEEHRKDSALLLGYVPDNDGDRGNIVYYDEIVKQVKILSAQELFALISSIEIALCRRTHEKVAVAVNGPTSLMLDHIAEHFSARLVRTEVGEANVVQAGEMLREEGYCVPLVGEGSNGGIILHPSRVRDPMNTLLSLIKLLTDPDLFREVTRVRSPRPSLALAIRSLEKRSITGSFSKKAKLSIKKQRPWRTEECL